MSRRSVPNIDPNDLRDHASTERVDRIWSRIEADLDAQGITGGGLADESEDAFGGHGRALRSSHPGPSPAFMTRKSSLKRGWLLLAAAAVFGGGIFVGRVASREPSDRVAAVGSTREAAVEVFASGSQARTFQLPNGGSILLEPESTLEVAEIADTGMTLRLLRGSASIDNTRAAGGSVAIVAGEARLSAPAGGIVAVRRNERDVDVIVSGGTVDLDAPGVHQHLSNGDRLHAVPISWPTAVLDPAKHHADVDTPPPPPMHVLHVARDGRPERNSGEAPIETASQPSWYSEYIVGHDEAALKLLEQQGDMRKIIQNAQSGAELAALTDLNGKNTALWLLAAERAVNEFPQHPKVVGFAFNLYTYYEKKGDLELAKKYGALAGDRFRDDIDCRALRRGDPASPETVERARAYLAKYPAGGCRADAESLAGDFEPQQTEPQHPEAAADPQNPSNKSPDKKPAASSSASTNGSAQPAPSAAPVEKSSDKPHPLPGEKTEKQPSKPSEKSPADKPAGDKPTGDKPAEHKN